MRYSAKEKFSCVLAPAGKVAHGTVALGFSFVYAGAYAGGVPPLRFPEHVSAN
jgi:hypothetical protein